MLLLRTFCCVKMNDLRIWAFAVALQTLLLPTGYCIHNHRRSMAVQGGLSVSKGGWRPVVGSSGLLYGTYGTYGTSQLQSPYKIPIPVMDTHQSSSRPAVTRDTTKITSIAQSYRPTTLRTSAASSIPAANQPINTYHNPFAIQNNGYNNFKFIQNYPGQSVLVRNPYNPYSDRNIYAKYPTKLKQNSHLQNGMLQQLTNVQPIQFGQYQAAKPLDIFGKPIETYVRPNDGKKSQSNIETFKPEVFKLDNDAAPQSINQHIKTAQQHSLIGQPNIGNPYFQYTYQNNLLPPNVLGSFGTFGVQTVKGRDPTYQFPTTFGPSQQPKQIFSYTYTPTHKPTAGVTDVITTRAPVTSNKVAFGTTYSDLKNTPTPQTKLYVPQKIDPNADYKDGFKPSPQDPYSKNHQSNFNKVFVNTYNSAIPTTTLANNFYEYSFPIHTNQQSQIYQKQPNTNTNYEKKKQVAYDSVTAGNQQPISTKSHSENVPSSYRPTYEVIESTESEFGTQTSPSPWPVTPTNVRQASKESGKRHEFVETLSKPGTTSTSLPEEYAIVTEAEKGYGNNLSNDGRVESQNKRPLSPEFEPIGAHKLKEYYYKVSTPIYDDYSTSTRTKPTESAKYTSTPEITTLFNNNKENTSEQLVTLPTLPPTQHYRRPSSPIVNEKDRVRKRNKVRRRRPVVAADNNNNNEETATRGSTSTVSTTAATITTGIEEVYTIRPRLRTTKSPPNLTTPTVTTDLTTSALPTISPTIPTTIVKKNLAHRRPITSTTARLETTTLPVVTLQDTTRQDSPIMKITSRTHLPRQTYDYKNDYTHKQDEKDTPTSDVTVSLSDTLRTTLESEQEFSFHKDFKPIEAKLEPMRNTFKETTTALHKEESSDYTTTSPSELTTTERSQRPRLRNKFHRNKFNVKDYRNRLSSTTTTTEQSTEGGPKVRLPQRRQPYFTELDTETTTERKKFVPKEPRHKLGQYAENIEPTEKDTRSFTPSRQRQTTTDYTEPTTSKVTSRVRNAQRKTRPPEDTTETNPTTIHTRRPLRKKIVDSDVGESVQDFSITENDVDEKNEITSERTRSESAIMKIADKKHHDHIEHLFEHSKRVSDLTLAASKDYNKPGMFKTVSSSSRRIPNYFTIATDDPILPIEAFFPQLNQKKES